VKRTAVIALAALALAAALGGCASRAHLRKADLQGRRLRLQLAEAYVNKGAYAAALPLVRQSVTEFPHDAEVRVLYATVLRERGALLQAERELGRALKLAPRSASAHAGLGIVYDLTNRSPLAEKQHRLAVKLAPRSATYWNNLGFSLLVAGRAEDAVPALEQAIELDPSLVHAYNNLGFAYARLGRDQEALRAFRSTVGEAGAYMNLAYVDDERRVTEAAATQRAVAIRQAPELERHE
jgi:Flp pilus assembly protein TadD